MCDWRRRRRCCLWRRPGELAGRCGAVARYYAWHGRATAAPGAAAPADVFTSDDATFLMFWPLLIAAPSGSKAELPADFTSLRSPMEARLFCRTGLFIPVKLSEIWVFFLRDETSGTVSDSPRGASGLLISRALFTTILA